MSLPVNRDPRVPVDAHYSVRRRNLSTQYGQMTSGERRAADLARVRENQRRSRARRREYVEDLETRLRQWELQGVEASAEVAMGARRVAEENRQLRELLHAHGVDDRRIAQHVQNVAATSEAASGTIPPMAGASTVQSLEQLMAPRRPLPLEPPGPPFTVLSQANREYSTPSPGGADVVEWQSPLPQDSGAGSGSYGSPTTAPFSSRTIDPQQTAVYPLPPMISDPNLSQTYYVEPEATASSLYRRSKFDPTSPSHTFEDDDHDHYTTQTSRHEDSWRSTRDTSSRGSPAHGYTRNGDHWLANMVTRDHSPFSN
ncbi:hypothetical protein LIA77_07488 [Sarocladium implicatum]|nr:hypothetical protein LIA77_07488 [Sarocladium implicatum]